MKVKIISVTDFDGKEKDKRIWGETRILDPNTKQYFTLNSIYTLEELGDNNAVE
jgi:hypothetical protein